MKTRTCNNRKFLGFTLLEAVGVLAVVAILAALIAPRIFAAIDDANLTADVISIKSVRSATEGYFRRYGKIGGVGGASITNWNNNAYEYWDRNVLMSEQFLEKPFFSKLATNFHIRVLIPNTNATVDPLAYANNGSLGNQLCNNGAYDLVQEYAANFFTDEDAPMYANAAAGSQRVPWALFSALTASRLPATVLFGKESHSGPLRGGIRVASKLADSIFQARKGFSAGLGWLGGSGLGPLQGIVQLVPRWPINGGSPPPPPPPPMGGGPSGPSNPSHTNSPPALNSNAGASVAVEVVLQGVSLADAYRLSLAIDGRTQSNWAYWDSQGRVKYDFGNLQAGTVFIYVAAK